jgi:hypothetical protein
LTRKIKRSGLRKARPFVLPIYGHASQKPAKSINKLMLTSHLTKFGNTFALAHEKAI